MRYSKVIETLQNLTGKKVTQKLLCEVLGYKQSKLGSRSVRDSKFTNLELEKLEKYFNVKLLEPEQAINSDSVSADYYPDVFGSCGNGTFALSEIKEKINIPFSCFNIPFQKTKQYSVINARGNSMSPFIQDKDRLIVQHWNGEQIIDNQIYVFCYYDEIFVKRLTKNVNQLVITSDNKDFDTIKLSGEELNNVIIVGQIVGLIRDLR